MLVGTKEFRWDVTTYTCIYAYTGGMCILSSDEERAQLSIAGDGFVNIKRHSCK